jgi:hypothetical protein
LPRTLFILFLFYFSQKLLSEPSMGSPNHFILSPCFRGEIEGADAILRLLGPNFGRWICA